MMYEEEVEDCIREIFNDIRFDNANGEESPEPEFHGYGRFLPSEVFYRQTEEVE